MGIKHIHVEWSGPLTYEDAKTLHAAIDYGVYQVYGSHPVYGLETLIYIGKADKQTFGTRFSQEPWIIDNTDTSKISIFVGRLSGYGGTPSEQEWSMQIALVERLLICAHWPAGNSSGINVQLGNEAHDVHILNWGSHKNLLPEVSGARYSNLFESCENYKPYEES